MTKPSKLVILELEGDCRTEAVRVRLEIGPETARPTTSARAILPPNPGLMDTLEQWRDLYHRLGQTSRIIRPQAILYDGVISVDECRDASQRLKAQFREWLAAASFRTVDERLREEVTREDTTRVLVQTQQRELLGLPWHLWRFIDTYPHSEVGLSSTLSGATPCPRASFHRRIKILAILGHSDGINTTVDQRLLKGIPGAEVLSLVQPERSEVSEQLWNHRWDILFFAGHSETKAAKGRIYLNPDDSLSLEELRYSLRQAISNGLQLAIFNSCDGLGLAYELEELKIPQLIVMREPVPDPVAHTFLKGFLQAFSRGDSLYGAVREARERLEGIEGNFPCASWLPVVYQNSIAPALKWSEQRSNRWRWRKKAHISQRRVFKFSSLLVPYIVASIVIACRMLGFLEALELKAYDHLMSIRPPINVPEERILTILVNEDDIQYQQRDRNMTFRGSLADEALLELLKKVEPYEPRVIGLDIIHDFPFEPELSRYLEAQESFFAICRIGGTKTQLPGSINQLPGTKRLPEVGRKLAAVPPPSEVPQGRIGFSDFPLDSDNVIRRQLFGMSPSVVCPTDKSLSFQMAWEYLNREVSSGITAQRENDDSLIIRSDSFERRFRKFKRNSGGYHLPYKEAQGYQILINYRHNNILSYSLEEVLSFDSYALRELIPEKMIFIGANKIKSDQHRTPLSMSPTVTMPGVLVHAQMASDILSSTLDGVSSIQWWPEIWENVWITAWSFVGFVICIILENKVLRRIALLMLLFLLHGLSFYWMMNGLWVPLIPCLISTSVSFFVSNRLLERISVVSSKS